MLVEAAISVDIEPYNALNWAVSQVDLDILALLIKGKFTRPISSITLEAIPASTPEHAMIRLMDALGAIGKLNRIQLSMRLVEAVKNQQPQLIDRLLHDGASIEFKRAAAVEAAIKTTNSSALETLLIHQCSAETLSAAIPAAMSLEVRSSRLQAMTALLKKGILPQYLGIPLQKLASEKGDVDWELIRLFIQQRAPVDVDGGSDKNTVLVAARRANIRLLAALCEAGPRNETVSAAVPIAFDSIDVCGYDAVLQSIRLLLEKGAAGLPINETLRKAALGDRKLEIVRLLLQHGAHADSAIFQIAIETNNQDLMKILCAKCPPDQMITRSVLYLAIHPKYYRLGALELLLKSTPSAASVLNTLWAPRIFERNSNITEAMSSFLRYDLQRNPNIAEFMSCFLRHGLDVDLGSGTLLRFAIQESDADLLLVLLSADPSLASLEKAFQDTESAAPRKFQSECMRLLLEKAKSSEIGQSEFLYRETRMAIAGDPDGLKLLLRHQADVNFKDGIALQEAVFTGSLEILDLFLSFEPSRDTLQQCCFAAASSSVSSSDIKNLMFQRFLTTSGGVLATDMVALLQNSIKSRPECTSFPSFLLDRGVIVSDETLRLALRVSSTDLFALLVNGTSDRDTVLKTFRMARETIMPPERTYLIYRSLLRRGVPSDAVSEALLAYIPSCPPPDLAVVELLLENGATTGYKKAEVFSFCHHLNSAQGMKLLC
ncbi:putative ankyrin repeat containing protein [Rosellinia necatrix]|uniref:Putative ankyrin repeat containing protein n=1 Tax=Rosellinia necatrix TaxID=77044 RepID=A0A1S8A834_ROSNE|nr:putative ankyrin repeat containing protein [Rosellinia necatrix]